MGDVYRLQDSRRVALYRKIRIKPKTEIAICFIGQTSRSYRQQANECSFKVRKSGCRVPARIVQSRYD